MVSRSFAVVLCVASVSADIYLHNPRGSNNRLDDENRDRNNANRMFDSQNNNRGGANVGSIYYYAGSKVEMEWSAQHSCGHENNHCEMILQAMCDDRIRDGTTTNRIPIKPNECYGFDCDTDVRFGRHESIDWYQNCRYRQRNKNLFTASQNLKGDAAIYTRQNPNGARRGLECPEERDYYPYWNPSPWKDIAILTNEESRCSSYVEESQNVKPRYYCSVKINSYERWFNKLNGNQKKDALLPLNQADCEAIEYEDVNVNSTKVLYGVWTKAEAHGIPPPECFGNIKSRDNHHGNVEGGQWNGFSWTVPEWLNSEQCVMRLRYNITTYDMPHFDNGTTLASGTLDASFNGPKNPKENAKFDIGAFYGLTSNTSDNGKMTNARGYEFKNNPKVDPFGNGVKFQLAVNTAQYGRTFQDRTHVFGVRNTAPVPAGSIVHNVNVRGKRGNIVQTYPGTEYDFTPNKLDCTVGQYVHFQWTGSNTNPNNNAGQGRQGSDRSNVVALHPQNYAEDTLNQGATPWQFGNSYPMDDVYDSPFVGFTGEELEQLAILNVPGGQLGGELSELDDAGTYFDGGVKQCTKEGVFNYMCTRNNNFSNRSQKGKITVSTSEVLAILMGVAANKQAFEAGSLEIAKDSFVSTQKLEVKTIPSDGGSVVTVKPVKLNLAAGKTLNVALKSTAGALETPVLMQAATPDGTWTEVEGATYADGMVVGGVTQGGAFKLVNEPNGGAIAGIVLGVLAILAIVGFVVYKKKSGGSVSGHMAMSVQ